MHSKPLEELWWHADVLKVMIWHTPAGIIDEGGKALEGFINFNITLMSAPENDRMTVSFHLATLALPASWNSALHDFVLSCWESAQCSKPPDECTYTQDSYCA